MILIMIVTLIEIIITMTMEIYSLIKELIYYTIIFCYIK